MRRAVTAVLALLLLEVRLVLEEGLRESVTTRLFLA